VPGIKSEPPAVQEHLEPSAEIYRRSCSVISAAQPRPGASRTRSTGSAAWIQSSTTQAYTRRPAAARAPKVTLASSRSTRCAVHPDGADPSSRSAGLPQQRPASGRGGFAAGSRLDEAHLGSGKGLCREQASGGRAGIRSGAALAAGLEQCG
jgi:hypothetical protein